MVQGIIGRKLGITQIFRDNGKAEAVTAIEAGPCVGRVFKGMRMAGRMGGERVTVRHLEVCGADTDRNLLLVKGAVPGNKNGILLIRKTGKGRNS